MIQELLKIKYYIIAMLIALGGYMWAMMDGVRIVGDDKQSSEERTANSARSFYHK